MSEARVSPTMHVLLALLLALLGVSGACWAQGEAAAPAGDATQIPEWNLEDCVAVALRNNPQVEIADAAVRSSEAAVTRARSGYYPQVSVDATAGVGGGGTGGTSSGSDRSSLGFSADWTFWQTGRRDTVMASRSELDATRLDYDDALQGLVQQVAVDYYAVLASRELVAVAEDGLRASEQQLESVRARIQDGKVADVEIYTAEADRATAELDLIDARTGERLALAQLRNTLGLGHDREIRIGPGTLDVTWQPPLLEDAIREALSGRPDLRSRAASLRARAYALANARDQRDPRLNVGGSLGYSPFAGANSRTRWSLSAGLTWSLFDGYALRSQEAQASASLRQASASLRQAELQATLEVESAYIELQRTEERIRAGTTSVTAAEMQLAGARGRYEAQRGILLEVTTARAAYTAAAANLVRSRFDRQVALVGVRRATGTLPVPSETTGSDAQGGTTP